MNTDKIVKRIVLALMLLAVAVFLWQAGEYLSIVSGILLSLLVFLVSGILIGGSLFNVYCLLQTCRRKQVGADIKGYLRVCLVIIMLGLKVLVVNAINGPHYGIPLKDMQMPYFHQVISADYGDWYWLLIWTGLLALFVIRFFHHRLSPLITLVLFSLVFLQLACWLVYLLQLFAHIGRLSVKVAYFGFIHLLLYQVRVIIGVINAFPVEKYRDVAFSLPNRLLYNSRHWSWIALLLMFPLLVICMLLVCLFGQQPDALIKAFTETSDWLLSQQVSPPKLPHNGHYLCTVSVQGHRRLVKPLRWGIRGNKRIWVNRQLLVANAFEQILEERMPRLHRWLRYCYDNYGYPIAKHITSPLRADIVYILMKPLELCFLIVIYCVDIYPENRIARQYLPGRWHNQQTSQQK